MKIKIKVNSSEDMIKLGSILTKFMYPDLVVTLNGDLGAGKTTFTKGVGEALGVKRVINSPTFTIMKIYDTNNLNNIKKLYHLDVYRLKDASDDFELEEYFEMGGVSIIEWADIIKDILPDNAWRIDIQNVDLNSRYFILEADDTLNGLREILEGESYEIIYW